MNIKHILSIVLMATTLFVACKKETTETNDPINNPTPTTPTDSIPAGLIKIGETYITDAGTKAVVYATKALQTGYNKLYFAMYDSVTKARLNDGHLEVHAMMDMGSMSHATPVENTEETYHTDKLWKANVYFIMPAATGWKLDIHFHNHTNDKEGEGSLEINVGNTAKQVVTSFVDSGLNANPVFLSMIVPSSPIVGVNDIEFAAHQKASADSFPSVNDYTVTMTPIMTSMGHSSPNNINPTHVGNGHYNGDVVFTMSGGWRIYLTLKRNNVVVKDSAYFDVEF